MYMIITFSFFNVKNLLSTSNKMQANENNTSLEFFNRMVGWFIGN